MIFPLLALMIVGAVLWFASEAIGDAFGDSALNKRQAQSEWGAAFGLNDDEPFEDEDEVDELVRNQARLLAKIVGFVAFNLGVLGIVFL